MSAVHSSFVEGSDDRIGFPAGTVEAQDIGALSPLIAGARARGIADAFELMGTAAILLSEVGSVLHVGASAKAFLDGTISIASRHLVAETARANRDLERLIAGAVSGLRDLQPVGVRRADAPSIEIRALRLADAVNDPTQLLKAILVLRELPASA